MLHEILKRIFASAKRAAPTRLPTLKSSLTELFDREVKNMRNANLRRVVIPSNGRELGRE